MFESFRSVPASAAQSEESSTSRRRFLRRGTLMGVLAVPVIGSMASSAEAGPVQDRQRPGKTGLALRGQFESIRAHENVHVTFLVTELGSAARPKPQFKNLLQRDFRSFAAVSQALENTGVGAYLNALPNITSRAYVSAAGSIALVEARHAGFLNNFQGVKLTASPANAGRDPSFDAPLTPAQVRAAAGGFIASLNGGPPIDYTPGDDISILNYALALEYLEADFYNINIPRFF